MTTLVYGRSVQYDDRGDFSLPLTLIYTTKEQNVLQSPRMSGDTVVTTFLSLKDLSEINRGGGGGGNFKFGFGNEVTHPCNGSEIF